jgi:hypothetical protein
MTKPLELTKEQLEVVKLYWAMLQQELTIFYSRVGDLERKMSKEVEVDLEFFQVENDFVGVGDYNRRMKLIHQEELEKR